MQIAHRKTQTDHKALSDRTEALAARLDAAQSDLRSAIGAHEDTEVLRTRVVAAEALMAELQARLVSAEARMAEAEQAAAVVEQPQQQQVSPCMHAPSALGAHLAQTEVPTTRKRKREDEEDAGEVAEVSAATSRARSVGIGSARGGLRGRRCILLRLRLLEL
jgi:hypothetical protein